MQLELTVNGLTSLVTFPNDEIAAVHRPLLQEIGRRAAQVDGRFLVLLAAPPGAGKSTLAAFWEWLAAQDAALPSMQALSIDGFHYPNRYLRQHTVERAGERLPLMAIKGAPETFNLPALRAAVAYLKQPEPLSWPQYDRTVHEPVPGAIAVTAPVVVVEGNYLLLDEPGWRELWPLADFTIFLEAAASQVRDGLIRRKVQGGYSHTEAQAHYERSDRANVERVLARRLPADAMLAWKEEPDPATGGAFSRLHLLT